MGNDISVGAVSNINVADISPHLAALVDAAGQTRPHGRVFTNLRCRYSRGINPDNSSNSQNNGGVLDTIGVTDTEIRWEDGTPVSVKVYLRSFDDAQELREIKKCLERAIIVDKTIRAKLSMANVAATGAFFYPVSILHQDIFRVTERAIWMARPWVQFSILQRLQMRPYCSTNRRLWFAFQLLRALSQLHDHCDLSHGDLKVENVLVDSHGWVYITDLSNFYKPTFLPAFDPEIFEKRYNTGVKSSCCIAPERFYDDDSNNSNGKKKETPRQQQVASSDNSSSNNNNNTSSGNTPGAKDKNKNNNNSNNNNNNNNIDPFGSLPSKNSDMFSAASVIVSIMNDVACFLSLSDVLALRKMLVDENDLAKAEQFYREKLSHSVSGDRPMDSQIADMIEDIAFGFGEHRTTSLEDVQRPTALQVVNRYTPSIFPRSFNFLYNEVFPGLLCLTPDLQCPVLFKNLEGIVKRIIELDYCPTSTSEDTATATSATASFEYICSNKIGIDLKYFGTSEDTTVSLERAAYVKQLSKNVRTKAPTLAAAFEVMSGIFVQLVRRCMLEQSLLMALSLLARAAPLFPDATLRDPILPLIITLLQSSVETTDTVRSFALDALVYVSASVETKLNPSNAFTFEDYILPALCECGTSFARSPACMVTLARVLPITYLLCSEVAEKREAMGSSFQSGFGYFGLRTSTVEKVWDTIKRLLNSSHTSVVVTALRSLPPLLPHLSADIVVGQVLPMLTLWFGSNYVELRREMFRIMFEVVAHCSQQHQALATVGLDLAVGKEDDVLCIASVLEGLREALLKKCFAKSKALEYVKKVAFLITHSSREVARAAASVIEAAVTALDPVELAVFVLAPIAPFLRAPVPVRELVKKNYDLIRPMCRVPDPPHVTVSEGAEFHNWCRDLAFFDLMTPTTMSMIISPTEVDRAAQIMRDCGMDLDPFFCLRFAQTVSTPSPLLSARLQQHHSHQSEEERQEQQEILKKLGVTYTGPLILFSERRGKLTPKLLNRHSNRLREIQITEITSQDVGSPWWAGASAASSANPKNLQSNASFARRNHAASMVGGGPNRKLGPGGATVANFNTAGGGGGGGGNTNASGGGSYQQGTKAPKPTGVSVASHSEAHRGGVRCMVSQNQYLATGGGDGTVRIWDTEDAILGAGYLDGRCHKNIFSTASNNNSEFGSPSSAVLNSSATNNFRESQSISFEPASKATAPASTSLNDNDSSAIDLHQTAPITALHFLGSGSGHTLVVGNEAGNACVYNVMAEAADIIPWTSSYNANHNSGISSSSGTDSNTSLLGGVVSICTPQNSEAITFLGMAGGVIGAIDIRSPTTTAVWTAKTPAPAGPLVNFMFPSKDRFWSCVSVNRGGLVALWDLRMRAIVSSTDVIIPVTAKSAGHSRFLSGSATGLSSTNRARLYSGDTNVTAACICDGFPSNNRSSNSFIPSVAVATDSSGIHRYDLSSMKEVLSMRPTNQGSIRALTSLGSTLYSGGTDSLLRNWDLSHPDRSFTISRGLEPSPPYSMITPTKVTEALPAAVDLANTGGGGGGWVDIDDNMNNIGGGSNSNNFGGTDVSSSGFSVNGSPLHSDGITAIAVVSATPSSAAVFGNRSFAGARHQSVIQNPNQGLGGGMADGSEQLQVCTGSRDGSIALWRNATSD